MKSLNKKADFRLKSIDPVERDGWIIQASTLNDTYILTIITSKYTDQCIIRYFDDENIAALFIDYLCQLDAMQEQDV